MTELRIQDVYKPYSGGLLRIGAVQAMFNCTHIGIIKHLGVNLHKIVITYL